MCYAVFRTARQWLWDTMGKDAKVAEKHMAACASESAQDRVTAFGIPKVCLRYVVGGVVWLSFGVCWCL